MSSKRETHRRALRPLIEAALRSPGLLSPDDFTIARYDLGGAMRKHLLDPDIAALEDYLIDHSALPGPRANLELIWAFGDEVGELCAAGDLSLRLSYVAMEWLLWRLLQRYPPAVYGDDPDSPLQMPQFCAALGIGEWAAAFQQIEAGILALLDMGNSPLWRMRETAAMGLQRMLARAWTSTLHRLQRASLDATPWGWRAIIAAVAEPDLLGDPRHALEALDMHYHALAYLRRLPESVRRQDDVRGLRKGLGYSVSVVVAAAPEAGFAQMRAWAAWNDPDVTWVLRENLKKKRLERWPDALAAVQDALG